MFVWYHLQEWATSKDLVLELATAYNQQMNSQTKTVNEEVVNAVHASELHEDQGVKKLRVMPLDLNSRYDSTCGYLQFHTLNGFMARFGHGQIANGVNTIIADADRHAQVTNNLNRAQQRQSEQPNKESNQPPTCKIRYYRIS